MTHFQIHGYKSTFHIMVRWLVTCIRLREVISTTVETRSVKSYNKIILSETFEVLNNWGLDTDADIILSELNSTTCRSTTHETK